MTTWKKCVRNFFKNRIRCMSSVFVKKQFNCLKYLAAHWVEYLAQQIRVIKIAVWHLPRFQSSKLSYAIKADCYDPGNILLLALMSEDDLGSFLKIRCPITIPYNILHDLWRNIYATNSQWKLTRKVQNNKQIRLYTQSRKFYISVLI